MLLIIFTAMTALAILAVLWPLGRKPDISRAGSDLLVYRDQLGEIDRDRGAGLIGEAEASAARVEVSRRLLAAADAHGSARPDPSIGSATWRRRAAAILVLALLLVGTPALYVALGSPDVPDQPASARIQTPKGNQSIAALISQVEAHLAKNPKDGAGWEVIAPVYMRMGRFDDAVDAWRKSLAINGETAARDVNLGEALVEAANGVVTADAKQAFQKAVAADPHEIKALYFLGLAEEQDGNREGAAKIWRAMLTDAPADAPWAAFVRSALARVTGEQIAPNGPSIADVAAADKMSGEQRAEMIRGMVAKLSDRLHENGGDVDGWVRLMRAYIVLGERAKAKDAAADARRALSGTPENVKRIDDLAKDLGLEG